MRLTRFHQAERAQGVVEFAIMSTIFLLLFAGTVDFSRWLYFDNAVRNAARVGAEAAMNHCPSAGTACGNFQVVTSDDVVLHDTICEAKPDVTLNPQFGSCVPCGNGLCGGPCNGTVQCVQADVAIGPTASNVRNRGDTVWVAVAYNFTPFTPIIRQFFSNVSCNGVTGTHNMCAISSGRVY